METSSTLFSLIIPTYNEIRNIGPLLKAAHAALADIPHEVIVVDDDSPDKTWQYIMDHFEKETWVKVLRRPSHRGLSSAVLEGFHLAQGNYLGVMDGDLSHDPTALPSLIQKLEEGFDLVVGSRKIAGGGTVAWPWYRKLISRVATSMAKRFLRVPLSDPMSGYFVLRRSFYEASRRRLTPQGYKILLELFCKGRPDRWAEVPILFRDRTRGHSKLSGQVIGQFLHMIWSLKRWKSASK